MQKYPEQKDHNDRTLESNKIESKKPETRITPQEIIKTRQQSIEVES